MMEREPEASDARSGRRLCLPSSALEGRQARRPAAALVALLLALVTVVAYLSVRDHGFIELDDAEYVADNAAVQAGLTWPGVKWAFTTGHASNWHPVTWLSHMFDAEWFGRDPAGPHVINVVLHALNTALLFLVLRSFTGAVGRSAVVAGLFALHPLHVESVAWIAERKDVLSASFFLLTLWCYGAYVRPQATCMRRRAWYAAATVSFAAGLMSKPMLVTLPCVLLLLDAWPLRRWEIGWRLVREKIPFFLLSAASCAATYVAQQQGGAVRSLASFSLGERVANAVVAGARYLGKTFWPEDLAVFYPHPGTWGLAHIALAAGVLLAVTAIAFMSIRQRPFLTMGWLWFCGMLVPVLGLVQAGNQAMADRYTYLPLTGVFIALVWSVHEIAQRRRAARFAMGAATAIVLVACAWRTTLQLRHWRNGEALFAHALAVTEKNFVAHHCLGHALLAGGKVDAAVAEFRAALAIQPAFADAHNSLGTALLRQGRAKEAEACFVRAIERQPDFALAHYNLGTVLLAGGRAGEAVARLEKARELRPGDARCQLNLGNALLQTGRLDAALACYYAVLKRQPDSADAHNNIGHVWLQRGGIDEAVDHFQQALAIHPDHVNARFNLGEACARSGRLEESASHFRKTLELAPDDADAREALAIVLGHRGDKREGAP